MERLREGLERALEGVIWSQWAALGAYVAVEPCRKAVVDPEALLVATCAFGRRDARIFDEALDWTVTNHALLRPWRLKKIAAIFGPGTARTLGAVLECVSREVGKDLFPGVREEASRALAEVEVEELFRREKGLYGESGRVPDEGFARWKLLRGTPRIRRHSGKPDLANPANLMLRLRGYYGRGARADVMTYLLAEGGGSSNGIAARMKYRQARVYEVLEGFVRAGVACKRGGRGGAFYWVDRERVAASLGLRGEMPAFFAWPDVFAAFHAVGLVLGDRWTGWEEDFLLVERMRDLMVEIVPALSGSGGPIARLPVPDARGLRGPEYGRALLSYLGGVAEVLEEYAAGKPAARD